MDCRRQVLACAPRRPALWQLAFDRTAAGFHHQNRRVGDPSRITFDFIFSNGGSGVDVFFVLSGFIIAYRHADTFRQCLTVREYVSFIRLRFARIYPVHFCMLVIVALPVTVLPIPAGTDDTALAFLLNLTLTQSWGIITTPTFDQPAWTISAEGGALVRRVVAG
jgi:peptidoglycan/LPS O-acetylase OafA/YrhL